MKHTLIRSRFIPTATVFLALATALPAAENAFVGAWVLDANKSKFLQGGPSPLKSDLSTITIDDGSVLKIEQGITYFVKTLNRTVAGILIDMIRRDGAL